jgi:hypothetical protein
MHIAFCGDHRECTLFIVSGKNILKLYYFKNAMQCLRTILLRFLTGYFAPQTMDVLIKLMKIYTLTMCFTKNSP